MVNTMIFLILLVVLIIVWVTAKALYKKEDKDEG